MTYPQKSSTTLHWLRQSHQDSGAGNTDHSLLVEKHQAHGKKNQWDGLNIDMAISGKHNLPILSERGEVTASYNINAGKVY